MKVKLSIKDRFTVPFLYPLRSGLQDQIIVMDIEKKVAVSAEERKAINCRVEGTGFKWDEEKCKDKEIDFSESEICFLKGQVNRLDGKGEISLQMAKLCLKIKEIDIVEKKKEK